MWVHSTTSAKARNRDGVIQKRFGGHSYSLDPHGPTRFSRIFNSSNAAGLDRKGPRKDQRKADSEGRVVVAEARGDTGQDGRTIPFIPEGTTLSHRWAQRTEYQAIEESSQALKPNGICPNGFQICLGLMTP